MNLLTTKANFKIAILKLPIGKFKLVGSIPENMCIEYKDKFGNTYLDSPIFETYEEAETFLNK